MSENWGEHFFEYLTRKEKTSIPEEDAIECNNSFWFDIWNNDVFSIAYADTQIVIHHWNNDKVHYIRSPSNIDYAIYLELLNEFKQKIGELK